MRERHRIDKEDPDNLLISWIPGKLTMLEEIVRLTSKQV
jgi:hypothetical protein